MESKAPPPSGPPKASIPETEFQWGFIPSNSTVVHIFELKNEGGDSLIIEQLRPHCGCSSAPLKTSVVHAGETVPLELWFNSRGFRGRQRKSASLHVRQGEELVPQMLYFEAFVDTASVPFQDGEIEVSTPIVEFNDEVESLEIELTNRMPAERELVIVDFQDDRIGVSWTSKKLKPKESTKLTITRKVSSERLWASITMQMLEREDTRITIPVQGENRRIDRRR